MRKLQIIGVLMMLAPTSGAVLVAAQKPVQERISIVNASPPPDTLADMIAAADAVVIVRATGQTRVRDWGNGLPVETIYSVQIEDTIKFSPIIPAVGDTMEIEVLGGTREFSNRVVRDVIRGQGSIRPNGRYLIFVRWLRNPAGERLVPCWNGAGIIDISGSRAKSLDEGFKRFGDLDPATFVASVRASYKQRPR